MRRSRDRLKWNYTGFARTRIGARAARCKKKENRLFFFFFADLRQPAASSSRPLLVTAGRRRAALSGLRDSAALFSLNMWSVPSSARAHTHALACSSSIHTHACACFTRTYAFTRQLQYILISFINSLDVTLTKIVCTAMNTHCTECLCSVIL